MNICWINLYSIKFNKLCLSFPVPVTQVPFSQSKNGQIHAVPILPLQDTLISTCTPYLRIKWMYLFKLYDHSCRLKSRSSIWSEKISDRDLFPSNTGSSTRPGNEVGQVSYFKLLYVTVTTFVSFHKRLSRSKALKVARYTNPRKIP